MASLRAVGVRWQKGRSVSWSLFPLLSSDLSVIKAFQVYLIFPCVPFPLVCFKVFDVDHDGVLSREEVRDMIGALLEVWQDNRTDPLPVRAAPRKPNNSQNASSVFTR